MGNIDPTFNGSVTLALTNNTGGAVFGGRLRSAPSTAWPVFPT